MARRNLHRATFVVAGLYNLAWGAYAVIDPQWVFRAGGMEQQRWPEVFACLGMMLALYGLLYFEVARAPERGWPIAAVGLAGKVLGPIGMAYVVATGDWTLRAALAVTITNDLIWWAPFALYLRDAWPFWRNQVASPAAAR